MTNNMRTLLLALGLGWAAQASAQSTRISDGIAAAPRPPATQSVPQADERLVQVAKDRAAVNDEYEAGEQVCYKKFFATNCLDKIKDRRRAALAALHAVEVEANHYKREAAVAQRDADLAERARKDADEQAQRALMPKTPVVEKDAPLPPHPAGPTLEQRQAEHDAKVKRQEAEDAANAGKRAANVAAYERKKQESEQRQADVAAKKAAKAEAAKKKAAAASASASASAAAPAASSAASASVPKQ